jgi:hypothetical protein
MRGKNVNEFLATAVHLEGRDLRGASFEQDRDSSRSSALETRANTSGSVIVKS